VWLGNLEIPHGEAVVDLGGVQEVS